MKRTHTAALVAGAFLVNACTTYESTSYSRPEETNVEYAYIQEGADFSKYTKLTTKGLEIYFPENAPEPPQADIERMRELFRNAFIDALGDDYEIVDAAGPDVLEVKAQLVDMKVIGAEGDYLGDGRMKDLVVRGQLTFLMEMIDSQSGNVLARAADKTWDGSSEGGSEADWDAVDKAARHWAGLFRDWLDRSLGKP